MRVSARKTISKSRFARLKRDRERDSARTLRRARAPIPASPPQLFCARFFARGVNIRFSFTSNDRHRAPRRRRGHGAGSDTQRQHSGRVGAPASAAPRADRRRDLRARMLDESRAPIRNALIHREKIFFARAASAKIYLLRQRADVRMRVSASAARGGLRCRKMSVRCGRSALNVRHRTQNKPPSTRRKRRHARLNARIGRRIKTPVREKNGREKIASASSRRAIFLAGGGVLTTRAAIIARAKSRFGRRLKKIFARTRASGVKALGFFHKLNTDAIRRARKKSRAKNRRRISRRIKRGERNSRRVSTRRCHHFRGSSAAAKFGL
jgi:hypothetical protein